MPTKFVVWNIIAAFSFIIIIYLIEPIEGVLPVLAILIVLAALTFVSIIFSRFIEKSPLPLRAINDGLEEFIHYIWVGWIGWQCNSYYTEVEDQSFAKKVLILSIASTCVIYVWAN